MGSSTGSASKSEVLEEAATFLYSHMPAAVLFGPPVPWITSWRVPQLFWGLPWGASLWFPTGAAVLARDRLSLQRHGVCRTLLPAAARHIYDFDELFNYRASFLKK